MCWGPSTEQALRCYQKTLLVCKWSTLHSYYVLSDFYCPRPQSYAALEVFEPSSIPAVSPNTMSSAGFHNYSFVSILCAARSIMKIFNKIYPRYNLQSNHLPDLSLLALISFVKSKSLTFIHSHYSLTLLLH